MTNLFDRSTAPLRAERVALRTPASDLRPLTSPRSGLTLIEMLVALAVTLVMMAAVVNLFANISGSIRNRRAAIETGAQLRQVRQRLAMDLNGATCRGTTWQRPEANQGYIEIIEGESSDKAPTLLSVGIGGQIDPTVSMLPSSQHIEPDAGELTDALGLGDYDDILALTVQSEKAPFTAQVGGVMVESPLAEVVWFATENQPGDPGETGMRKVYRRVLLIAPWLGPWASGDKPANVSVHWDPSIGTGQWVANTLGDLTKRENRVAREPGSLFPHPIPLWPTRDALFPVGSARQSHLVLDNALAFDIRVFDPGAPLYDNAGTIVEPSDLGWDAAYGPGVAHEASDGFFDDFVSQGAYVDMGYAGPIGLTGKPNTPAENFPINRPPPSPQPIRPVFGYPQFPQFQAGASVYDTWSYHYENDGINQDAIFPPLNAQPWQLNITDQGSNGLDDDNTNGVDDMGERETRPPYDVPLRGIKAILRVYEPDARQIRESSVTHSFKQ